MNLQKGNSQKLFFQNIGRFTAFWEKELGQKRIGGGGFLFYPAGKSKISEAFI